MSLTRGLVLDVANQLGGAAPGVVTLHDFSREKNDGTITGATWVQLPTGLWTLNFDYAGDYVTHSVVDWAGDISVEIWFYLSNYPWPDGRDTTLLDNTPNAGPTAGTRMRLYHNNVATGMRPLFYIGDGGGPQSAYPGYLTDWQNNTWYHFVGVNNSAVQIEIWRDAIQLDNSATAAMAANPDDALRIGSRAYAVSNLAYGSMAIIRVYNYALSPAQIRARYHSTKWIFGVAS